MLAIKKANQGITQIEIAQRLGLSQAGVSKAIKAASIDENLIALFPVADELSHPDYALLDKVMKAFNHHDSREAFIAKINAKLVNIQTEYLLTEQKDAIISKLKNELKLAQEKLQDNAKTQPLMQFETKGMFARKRVNGRNFSYEFGRLSKEIQDELDAAIHAVLNRVR